MDSQTLLQRAKSRRQPDEAQQLLPTCPMVYAIIDEASLEEAAAANAAATAAAAAATAAAAAAGGASAGSPRSTDAAVGGGAVGGGGSVGSAGSLRGLGEGNLSFGGGSGRSAKQSWDLSSDGGGSGRRAGGGGGGLGGAERAAVLRAQMSSLSLAVECLLNTAVVTLEGTWTVSSNGIAPRCEWLFALPINHKVSVSSVEVVTTDSHFFTTAIVTKEEAESAAASSAHPHPHHHDPSPHHHHTSSTSSSSSSSSSVSNFLARVGSGRLGSGVSLGGSGGGGERGSGGGLLKRLSSGKSTANGSSGSLDLTDQSGGLLGGKGAVDFSLLGSAGEGLQRAGVLLQESGGDFNPAMFRMRLPAVQEGTQVKVRVSYVETMAVRAGYYEVVVPLLVPDAVVPSHLELVEVVQVSCAINSGHTRPLKVGDFNHPMKVMFVELGRASFTGFPASTTPDGKPCVWPNADFVLSYQVVCEDVAAAMLVQAPYEEDPDTRAIFCLSVCPPDPCQLPVYGRAVVFILDSHNAMRGRAMEEARRAVMAALKRLSPADSFGIIAFDYELLVFAEAMESGTAEAVKKASKFVLQAYDTDEACNILSPLQLALKMLKGVRGMLPQIVLLSDAAVEDERSICCYLQEALLEWGPNAPRIFTCGIGPSCSYYFLRWIAGVSRGATEFAFTADEVRKKVERLLLAVSRPLITNITIRDMPAGFQLVPFPIPDLYAACPVTVSGRLEGDVPLALELRGVRANGAPWKAKVPVVEAATLPLSTVGIREHTDLMTADAWLQRDPDLERGVARMSQTVCVPSHFTRMVLFETNRASYDALQHDRIQGKDLKVRTYTDPPSAPVSIVPGLVIGLGGPAVAQKQVSQLQQEQQQRGPGGLLGEVLEEEEEEGDLLLQSRQGRTLGLLGSIMSCYRPNSGSGSGPKKR
ncbi:hypothetical protein CLOM_g16955 [Closterium sp. NIES-68]|nr:hypothetical protein CLOM_g16955 [Closterium sp. NIES-68]GJP85326.1 hypothetical protein CLOP_g15433 [Closterium sp. NIES-67]